MLLSEQKIGLFGGTFNPIHKGHLIVARDVKDCFGLDKIWLIPAAIPPHKKLVNVADAADRLEMIRMAIESDDNFLVSDVELVRSGPSYTIDTVNHFKSILSNQTRLFFIVGIDAFLDIKTWKSFEKLFDVIPFIVMSRPQSVPCGHEISQLLCSLLSQKVCSRYHFVPEKNAFFHPEKKTVYMVNVTASDISATKVRQYVRQRRPIDSLVSEKVKNYIQSKGLYL